LLLDYYPVDNTLFEISTEIRCSSASSRYFVMEPRSWFQAHLKTLYHIN